MQDTNEYFASTTYYGIGNIIRRYAGFPRFLPLPVSVQHGWSLTPVEHDARRDAPENWYWSKDLESQYKDRFAGIRTRAVGAPFLYLLEVDNYRVLPKSQRAGSIVFPSHSSSLIEMVCDFEEYADLLDQLPTTYRPITVCMYYLDLERGLDAPFLKRGFRVVTNGSSLYDEDFLASFVHNSEDKLYAFSNQMTSALLFASIMGLTSFFFGPRFEVLSSDPNYRHLDYTGHHRGWESRFAAFFEFPDCDVAKQRKVTETVLGVSNMLSSSQMRRALWQLVFRKEYGKQILSGDFVLSKAYRYIRRQVSSRYG